MRSPAVAILLLNILSYSVNATEQTERVPTEVIAQETKLLVDNTLPDHKEFREDIKGNLSAKGQVIGIQKLPITKLFFVEAQQGTYLVSADGRFVFEGKLTDVWHRRKITNLKAARATERTPLSNLGFKPEEQLAAFTIGNPDIPRQGIAFVDPTSMYTQNLMKQIQATPEKYNWTIILMPAIGGEQAMNRARKLWCAKDRALAINDLTNGTNESTSELKNDCSEEPIVFSMMLTDIFQITGLPHIVREDGLTISGFPPKFMTG